MLIGDEVLGQPRAEKSITAGYPNVQANIPNELIGVVPVRQLPVSCSLLVVVAPSRGAQECHLPVSLSVHTRATSWREIYLRRSVEYRPHGTCR